MNIRLLAPLLVLLAACTTDVTVGDSPGRVVAVGPVWLEGDRLVIELATWDHEGDAQSLRAVAITGAGEVPLSAAALAPYSLASVPTARATETRHVLEWAFETDGIAPNDPISLRFSTEDPSVPAVVFGPFVPSALAPTDPLPPPVERSAP